MALKIHDQHKELAVWNDLKPWKEVNGLVAGTSHHNHVRGAEFLAVWLQILVQAIQVHTAAE